MAWSMRIAASQLDSLQHWCIIQLKTQEVAGLTIRNFSVHAHTAREIPLSEIDEDPAVKSLLLQLLSSPPVTHFLRVVEGAQGRSAMLLQPSLQEAVVG